ncbi:hypothetical protein F7Q99_27840 [Streptomyces kaniharaensis]|uniref:Uncharacterized protein n=1 Tax=Streptomyces kaniharaensis TaxID=212423 RepID=A0A6N7KWD7_9ACTN|nr:hypothetical protein [Streptomyces kaniharaensis]MQS15962.1 hypothetical protein [Streptomyces kaniharaensis]
MDTFGIARLLSVTALETSRRLESTTPYGRVHPGGEAGCVRRSPPGWTRGGGAAQGRPGFEYFTFDHTVNGVIDADGEELRDIWQLLVRDNDVSVDGPVGSPNSTYAYLLAK